VLGHGCGLVALSYMGCAVTLLLFNKAALSSYKFPNANVITLAQLCCANALLFVLRKTGAIAFTAGSLPLVRLLSSSLN